MNTHVTYVIRLIGSFQTITIHGRSGSWTSSPTGARPRRARRSSRGSPILLLGSVSSSIVTATVSPVSRPASAASPCGRRARAARPSTRRCSGTRSVEGAAHARHVLRADPRRARGRPRPRGRRRGRARRRLEANGCHRLEGRGGGRDGPFTPNGTAAASGRGRAAAGSPSGGRSTRERCPPDDPDDRVGHGRIFSTAQPGRSPCGKPSVSTNPGFTDVTRTFRPSVS